MNQAARVTAFTVFLDMIPRSAGLGFVTGSVAVTAKTGALGVVAEPFTCKIQGFQARDSVIVNTNMLPGSSPRRSPYHHSITDTAAWALYMISSVFDCEHAER